MTLSSAICFLRSRTRALPTDAGPRTRYSFIDRVVSQSIGTVTLKKTVSTIPENRAIENPGPKLSVSIRPFVGPFGVEKSTLERRLVK